MDNYMTRPEYQELTPNQAPEFGFPAELADQASQNRKNAISAMSEAAGIVFKKPDIYPSHVVRDELPNNRWNVSHFASEAVINPGEIADRQCADYIDKLTVRLHQLHLINEKAA